MNSETAKIKAKSKLILWSTLLLCFGLLGGAWEYLHHVQPLDQKMLIFKPGNEAHLSDVLENTANDTAGIKNVVSNEVKVVEEKTEQQEGAENHPIQEPEAEFEALSEFLVYMQELQQQVEEIGQHVSVLDKIKQEEIAPKEEKSQQVHLFDERKIEVYDSEKGVVGVIDVAEQRNETVENVQPEAAAEIKEKVLDENDVTVVDAVEKIENAAEEINDTAEKAQMAAVEAENLLRENVQAEMQRVEESGDEAPIILIPGLQNM